MFIPVDGLDTGIVELVVSNVKNVVKAKSKSLGIDDDVSKQTAPTCLGKSRPAAAGAELGNTSDLACLSHALRTSTTVILHRGEHQRFRSSCLHF